MGLDFDLIHYKQYVFWSTKDLQKMLLRKPSFLHHVISEKMKSKTANKWLFDCSQDCSVTFKLFLQFDNDLIKQNNESETHHNATLHYTPILNYLSTGLLVHFP